MIPASKKARTEFFSSPYTWMTLSIRIALVFELYPHEWVPWIHGRPLRSAIVDPIYTLQHVLEAEAIRRLSSPSTSIPLFANSYSGGQIHLPPLLLACLEPILSFSTRNQELLLGIMLMVVDIVLSWSLERIGRAIMSRSTDWEDRLQQSLPEAIRPKMAHVFPVDKVSSGDDKPMIEFEAIPMIVANIYFCSPLCWIASSALFSFQNLPNMLTMLAVMNALEGSIVWSAFCLAAATYCNLHNAIFMICLCSFIGERRKNRVVFATFFLLFSAVLQAYSFLLVGSRRYLGVVWATHGWTFQLQGIQPSLSTLWYLGMQMFDRFSTYFTIILGTAPYLLVGPLMIRLNRYPEALMAILWLMGTLFRPPATLISWNIGLSLLLLSPRSLARIKVLPTLIPSCAIIVPVALYLVTTWLWLDTGSGEANFIYFQCLAYNIFIAVIFVQFCSACLRRDKALRLTQKKITMTDQRNAVDPNSKAG